MIPLFTKNLRAHQAKRLLAAVVLFSVFVTCLIGGELSPSAALVAQITNQWSKVPAQALRHAAEAGDAQAQYYLYLSELSAAQILRSTASVQPWQTNSPDVGPNITTADFEPLRAKWSAISESEVQQAALRGDRGARWYLRDLAAAKAYQRETNAWVWVERSANQGCPPAEYVLASKFLGYPGILPKPADAAEGLKWVQRGLAHGFESAQHRYAELLLDGNLVVPNIAEAIDWLRKAADQGCPRAEFQLAQQYGCGNGEPRSADDTPVALLKRAARSGWGPAQYALGERYRFGLGVEADPAKAVYWYTLSAYRGERDLTRRRAKLESSLTPQDRQKLTDWLARPDAWSD